ncbi:MAG: HAD family hydrolase [Candidatus Rokuibacteriota bacterium]
MSQKTAILFDFGGTLDSDGIPWKARVARLFEAAGVPPRDGFDPLFYAADDTLVGAVDADLPLRDTVERLVLPLGEALGASSDVAAGVAARFTEETLGGLRARAPLLTGLARRYRLGIVSNFYGNLERVCADAGIAPFFGTIVDSARVGAEKPDPRIFGAALAALDVAPADALFVGDSLPRDMAGARGVGMAHAWLAPAPAARACCPDDPVIHALDELEALLA